MFLFKGLVQFVCSLFTLITRKESVENVMGRNRRLVRDFPILRADKVVKGVPNTTPPDGVWPVEDILEMLGRNCKVNRKLDRFLKFVPKMWDDLVVVYRDGSHEIIRGDYDKKIVATYLEKLQSPQVAARVHYFLHLPRFFGNPRDITIIKIPAGVKLHERVQEIRYAEVEGQRKTTTA